MTLASTAAKGVEGWGRAGPGEARWGRKSGRAMKNAPPYPSKRRAGRPVRCLHVPARLADGSHVRACNVLPAGGQSKTKSHPVGFLLPLFCLRYLGIVVPPSPARHVPSVCLRRVKAHFRLRCAALSGRARLGLVREEGKGVGGRNRPMRDKYYK